MGALFGKAIGNISNLYGSTFSFFLCAIIEDIV